ncbi:phosphate ABC transporter substrate-binding protein PstS [Frigoriglobus tundricola]|uniref:Phosphate-binding protein PstS n=1 Tax=Frigoriglobus tundricola TaxID=2774151 RepID=A0A6M5YRP9_9BACT|nr:phosphate ABC transporter substrate-binding protein PstS [Frigoriglobus tundricola]QJW96036.1 Phosphate ABC transporter, substrate-binding protein PstS [Frigoriglobus tundricola]
MPPTQTRDTFLTLVERSGLLGPERIGAYREGPENPVELARALVRDRLLTPYQAQQLLRGKYRGYFLTEKYKVLDELGRGGMGRVLLCEHLLLQKLVALKLLNSSWTNVPGTAERFLREARASAAVDHPNIVRVYDVDRAAGVPFMVMEFVDGKNLHQLVAEHGPLAPARAAEYVRQAAVGLEAARSVGLVHRDIKPANLLLDRAGVIRLADLGLARFLGDAIRRNENLTQQFDPNSVLGTLDFIAPEQADNSSAVDIRADIYSLGHTLYYLLTGKMPFGNGSTAQKLMWHQLRHPEPPSVLRPEVSAELEAVFRRMTEKDPGDRYQTPAEVVAAFRALSSVPAPPPSPEEMPRVRADSFLLGLSPPPSQAVLSGSVPAPPTPTTTDTAVGPSLPAKAASPSSSHPAGGDGQPASGSDVLRSVRAEVPNPPAEPAPSGPARGSRRVLLAFVVLLGALGTGGAVWFLSPPKEVVKDKPLPPPPPDSGPGPVVPVPSGVVLTGEGSSFVDPMMQHWAGLYQPAAGVTVKYTKSGSSAGVRALLDKRVMFSGTDAHLTNAQLLEAEAIGGPVVHVPLVMGAVVVTYNLPGEKKTLRFNSAVLADIYLGKITKWNDDALRACNPGVAFPNLPITVAHRKDGSGTTFIWTDYLSKVSGEWKAGPGVGNVIQWPVEGVGADKNDGMANEVRRTVGAIGYVEHGFALTKNLPFANIENEAGEYVAPTLASVTAAAAAELQTCPADLRFRFTNARGRESYPISGITWAVLYKKQPAGTGKPLVEFLRWAVHDGQKYATDLQYAPLPPALVKRIDAVLDTVTVGP